MNLLMRRRELMQSKEEKPNLATVSEFTTYIDSFQGRVQFPLGLQAKIKKGTKYNVSFDISVKIEEVQGAANLTQVISKWPTQYFDILTWGACARGVFAGYEHTWHYDQITTATSNDLEGIKPLILQYDSYNLKGTFYAHNFIVKEV